MRFLVFIFVANLTSHLCFAQIDVSSELLLAPSATDNSQSPGLESGRYKVKKVKNLPSKKAASAQATGPAESGKPVVLPAATTTTTTVTSTSTTVKAASTKETSSPVGQLLFSPQTQSQNQAQEAEKKTNAENQTQQEMAEPSVVDQVRDMMDGKGQTVVEAYKEQIHPDDIRLNFLEVDLLPGVVSNNSKSSYSYRNYNTFSPKMLLGAKLWLTPFLGVYGQYTTTMGGDVVEDPTTETRSTAQHEWTELGFNVRKFFGMSRKSNSLQFGIHLSEYKFKVPGDSQHRVQLRSSGVGLHLLTRIPVAPSYSWTFGGKVIPRIQHTELGTGIDLSSGSNGESSRIELMVGGEFKLSRENQILWDLTTSYEKNQFNGSANTLDPESGLMPRGVAVENTFLIFSLGYRWGQ
ncbi:MAG: hypothetical protein ACAH59_09875 [Pseudobdellovibrionaceae bacterium]